MYGYASTVDFTLARAQTKAAAICHTAAPDALSRAMAPQVAVVLSAERTRSERGTRFDLSDLRFSRHAARPAMAMAARFVANGTKEVATTAS